MLKRNLSNICAKRSARGRVMVAIIISVTLREKSTAMTVRAVLTKSWRMHKKWVVLMADTPPIHFGDVRYSDYLLHSDDERKRQYLARHQHQDWTNPRTAAFWSRFVSWNRPTMRESLREIKQLFDIDVRLV